jgi:hypothetical protein
MSKFNLNKPIIGAEGHPLIDRGAMYFFASAKEVEVLNSNGKPKTIKAMAAIEKEPSLTYAKSIRNALRNAGNSDKDEFDKDDCGTLLFKLVADTNVELNVDERKLILDASRKFAGTEENYRIKELIDSGSDEEEGKEDPKGKKGKK